jgi:hypothetical protein
MGLRAAWALGLAVVGAGALLSGYGCADSKADATNPFATPAFAGSALPDGGPPSPVVINEIDPSGDPVDWIELKNTGSSAVDLSGYALGQGYDGVSYPTADSLALLPAGATLAPGAYLVVYSKSTDADAGGFGISKSKAERITLFNADQQPLDDTTTDGSATDAIPKGTSWARDPDGTGPFGRHPSTQGATNRP